VSAKLNVNQPAPLVTKESIELLTNKNHRVTEVIVGFSGGLELARAQNTAEYRLVKAGKKGVFAAKHARLIKLRSAACNWSSDTLTLRPNKPFALTQPIQLEVMQRPPQGWTTPSGDRSTATIVVNRAAMPSRCCRDVAESCEQNRTPERVVFGNEAAFEEFCN
jgi:hypothetical protein